MTASVAASRAQPNAFARRLFSGLPDRYDRLATILSFGQDPRWRRELVDHVAASSPSLVLDVACGPAAVTRRLAERTEARIVGVDLSREMLAAGAANVARDGIASRVGLALGRGEQLPFEDARFDALSVTYLLRYVADPEATVAELARVVRPGGAIASLEFSVPDRAAWRTAWWGYTRLVLPVAGLLTGGRAWFDVGRFLGPSISQHYARYPVEWTLEAWRRAGVDDVACRRMSLGGGIVIWGTKS